MAILVIWAISAVLVAILAILAILAIFGHEPTLLEQFSYCTGVFRKNQTRFYAV